MNSLCSVHSHGFHNAKAVAVVATQPTVTGGTLVGLYNFNSTVTTIPTIGNGIAPSWRSGTGSISTSTFHNGTGSLSSVNSADNQLYLGAYTFTNNNQFSVAFWFYPIRTTLLNNYGSYNFSTSSTPSNQYIVIIQNTNANATNNTRFQPFGWGSCDATNLMITGDQWTHITMVINGLVQRNET